jgi:transposase
MPSRTGPVHVATTTRRYKGKVYRTHLLRRTYRDQGKVKHETLGNLSHLPEHTVELVRRSLRGDVLVGAEETLEMVRSLPHGHVAAALGTLRRLGLPSLISARRTRERDLVIAMIVARVLEPCSKLATSRSLVGETASSSLGSSLGLGAVDEEELYGAMDWLVSRQGRIENGLAKRHVSEASLVLYDVSSAYLEGRHCPLGKRGYSRDGKKGKLQIEFGLLCNAEGCPVAVEVFEGDTADPRTLRPALDKLRKRFGFQRVVMVGDRGLITSARIREDLKPYQAVDWITALRAPAIAQLLRGGSLQLSLFDEKDLVEIEDPSYPGERLVVCRNPLLAEERARKRQELLEATEEQLDKIVEATQRPKRRLRGKDQIALRVGRVLGRYKMGKHFRLNITEESFAYEREQEQIEREAMLDGVYVIRTSVPETMMTKEDVVRSYKQLSRVERAFRCLKGIDLRVRPVYHRLPDRVRAHVLLCMLGYYVEWHMRHALAPLLFQDDDRAGAKRLRVSVVAPAQRSRKAQRKAATKQTEAGTTVHSFSSLLKDLRTVVKSTLRPRTTSGTSFEMVTTPTPTQKKAFELLGVGWT